MDKRSNGKQLYDKLFCLFVFKCKGEKMPKDLFSMTRHHNTSYSSFK
jgi:hypothetical protein